jgi:hypothetical protein
LPKAGYRKQIPHAEYIAAKSTHEPEKLPL